MLTHPEPFRIKTVERIRLIPGPADLCAEHGERPSRACIVCSDLDAARRKARKLELAALRDGDAELAELAARRERAVWDARISQAAA